MIVMKQHNPLVLGKREINLLFLIGSAILFVPIGHDIRQYIDTQEWFKLAITIGITTSLFVIIKKSLKVVMSKEKKE